MKTDLTHSTSADHLTPDDTVRLRPDDAENVIQLVLGDPFPIAEHAICIDGPFDLPAWKDLALVVDAITNVVASVCGQEKCMVRNTPRLIKERHDEIVAGAAVYLPGNITYEQKVEVRESVGHLFHLLKNSDSWSNLDFFGSDKHTKDAIRIAREVLEVHGARKLSQPVKVIGLGDKSQTLCLFGRLLEKPRKLLVPATDHLFFDGIMDRLGYSRREFEILTLDGKRLVARIEIALHWDTLISLYNPPTPAKFEFCETLAVTGNIEFVLVAATRTLEPISVGL